VMLGCDAGREKNGLGPAGLGAGWAEKGKGNRVGA
jgi:hypothetical protein